MDVGLGNINSIHLSSSGRWVTITKMFYILNACIHCVAEVLADTANGRR